MNPIVNLIARLLLYIINFAGRVRAVIHLEQNGSVMADRGSRCMLLELPPELRNHIYTFTTSAREQEHRCIVPSYALLHTCRQIHHEYRAICLRGDVIIDWKHVSAHLRRFYPSRDGAVKNIELGPGMMTLFTNPYTRGRDPVEIDLLPILKFGLANKWFNCRFLQLEPPMCEKCGRIHAGIGDLSAQDAQDLFTADVNTIQALLSHRNPDWIADLTENRIHNMWLSQIGTNYYPRVKFCIGPGKDELLPIELEKARDNALRARLDGASSSRGSRNPFDVFAARPDFDIYMERVGLDKIFSANRYHFRWDHEWVEREARCSSSRLRLVKSQIMRPKT